MAWSGRAKFQTIAPVGSLAKRMYLSRPPVSPLQPLLHCLALAPLVVGNTAKSPHFFDVFHQQAVLVKCMGGFMQRFHAGLLILFLFLPAVFLSLSLFGGQSALTLLGNLFLNFGHGLVDQLPKCLVAR